MVWYSSCWSWNTYCHQNSISKVKIFGVLSQYKSLLLGNFTLKQTLAFVPSLISWVNRRPKKRMSKLLISVYRLYRLYWSGDMIGRACFWHDGMGLIDSQLFLFICCVISNKLLRKLILHLFNLLWNEDNKTYFQVVLRIQ